MVVNPLKSYPVESYHDRRVNKLYSDINMNKDREAEIVQKIAEHLTASHFGFLDRPGAPSDKEMEEWEQKMQDLQNLQKITPEQIEQEKQSLQKIIDEEIEQKKQDLQKITPEQIDQKTRA